MLFLLTRWQIRARSSNVLKSSCALAHSYPGKFTSVRWKATFTSHSFMQEYIRISGMKRFPAGRMGDAPARGLSQSLARAGFGLGRLQTGTPARLDAQSVNLKDMEVQEGDVDPSPFSFLNVTVANKASQSLARQGPLLISYRTTKWHVLRLTQPPRHIV
jgi:tRNA U34 5-carboxymethylaminomethyl modifying enzyme MnmG/GidA